MFSRAPMCSTYGVIELQARVERADVAAEASRARSSRSRRTCCWSRWSSRPPGRTWLIAAVCTLASVAGGMFGYALGALLFDSLGRSLLEFYGHLERFAEFQAHLQRLGRLDRVRCWADALSLQGDHDRKRRHRARSAPPSRSLRCSRGGGRFFAVAALLWWFGVPIRRFIEANLGALTVLVFILLLGGFLVLKLLRPPAAVAELQTRRVPRRPTRRRRRWPNFRPGAC